MSDRKVRFGIDVGGTFTKAVAIDNDTHEIIGKSSVKTTHDHEWGVAAGVVQTFQNCMSENDIKPEEVIFIAHSTTQATNALIEGDVANVGILGLSKGGLEGLITKKQTNIPDIPLGAGGQTGNTGKFIRTSHAYRTTKTFDKKAADEVVTELQQAGAGVIVASKAFGVDGFEEETLVNDVCTERGIPCTQASDITKLYGLTVRTRTAAINASILPKMLSTANSTQESVRSIGITVPLMMMRGDGGVMEVEEMKKRPVLTMLSGPAASVVGALMYLRASNGIYFEVGGTTTNIGVIKNGRPTVSYSIVGNHRTYINSLDVRVLGVAGGSLVRAGDHKIIDVGPRSSHIAGLPYAAFTPTEEIEEPELEFFRPKKDDPDDYVCIKLKSGKRIAITNTCAANVLKLTGDKFASGNYESCVKAMKPFADYLGCTVEEAATRILEKACEKIVEVINTLSEQYNLETDQTTLVGCGGGAAALIPFTAKMMGLRYSIPENAEVISSIGVALAMVRDMVERVIPNPTAKDIADIKREAKNKAIESGAVPDSVEVHIEIDSQRQKVTAIAMGSTEVQTTDLLKECSEEEARALAADSLGVEPDKVNYELGNGSMYIYTYDTGKYKNVRIVDKKGFIRIQRRDGEVAESTVRNAYADLEKMWRATSYFRADSAIVPDVFVVMGGRILDFAGILTFEQLKNIISTELDGEPEDTRLLIVGARNTL